MISALNQPINIFAKELSDSSEYELSNLAPPVRVYTVWTLIQIRFLFHVELKG